MSRFNHKFIKIHMVVICFFFWFGHHQYVYAATEFVEIDGLKTFDISVEGDFAYAQKCLAQFQTNLGVLGVTTINDLKRNYSDFRLNNLRIESHFMRIMEHLPNDQIINTSSKNNIINRTSTDVLEDKEDYDKILFQHFYNDQLLGNNSLKVLMQIYFPENPNKLILTVKLWVSGFAVQGTRFKVNTTIGDNWVFTLRE